MKAVKIAELNSQFSFEAPFINTKELINAPINKKAFLDLNLHLAPNPKDIYLVRVNGESMIDEKIYHGDVLIVNKNEKPKDGKVVMLP
jgi:SOS-response transcriptional repressor LexA